MVIQELRTRSMSTPFDEALVPVLLTSLLKQNSRVIKEKALPRKARLTTKVLGHTTIDPRDRDPSDGASSDQESPEGRGPRASPRIGYATHGKTRSPDRSHLHPPDRSRISIRKNVQWDRQETTPVGLLVDTNTDLEGGYR